MSDKIFKRRSSRHPQKHRTYLDDLIRHQDWDAVREAIRNAAKSRIRSSPNKITCSRRCSSSALALAVSHFPPSDVVASLLKLEPEAATRRDRCGRLPLHVACSAGASLDVVYLLLLESSTSDNEKPSGEVNLDAAPCADADYRVPLHYAAEYAVGSYGETLDIVAVLCVAYPAAASAPDAWGETPRDIVAHMEENASLDGDLQMLKAARAVGRVLQQTPMISWRRNSRIGRRTMMAVNSKVKSP